MQIKTGLVNFSLLDILVDTNVLACLENPREVATRDIKLLSNVINIETVVEVVVDIV